MTFSQENRKLQKIFNDIKTNKTALDNKRNEQTLLTFFKQTIKPHYILSDTNWLAKAPDLNDLKTINKSALLPESVSINLTQELEIPDFLLPYIDVQMLIRTPPDSLLTSYVPYSTENYTGDYINIQGDGGLIYTGVYPLNAGSQITEAELDVVAPESHTRKIWQVTVNHTDPDTGDEYVTSGELQGIFIQENPESCERDTDPGPGESFVTIDIVDVFNARWYLDYEHEISAFDENGFTGIGDYEDKEFSTGTPDCDISSTITQNVEMSFTFSAVDNYFLFIKGTQFNITTGTFIGFSGTIKEVNGAGITSYDLLQFNGYRVFYSTNRAFQLQVGSTGSLILQNLPDDSGGIPLPYTNITLERNLGDLVDILDTETSEDIFLRSSLVNITNGNDIRKDVALFKIQDGNSEHFPSYYMKIGIGVTILSPAVDDDPNPHIDTQIDTYTVSGTTYTQSGDVDGLVSEAFVTASQDVQYRIQIVVRNPLWYQEIRKYDSA